MAYRWSYNPLQEERSSNRQAKTGAARPRGHPLRLPPLRLTPSARLELSVHLNDITQFARPLHTKPQARLAIEHRDSGTPDNERKDPGWHRRLDLRALARNFLSKRSRAKGGARICEPAANLNRDQRNLLRHAEGGELRAMARGDARGLRVRAQGPEVHHEPAHPRRGRGLDRALFRERCHASQREARPGKLAGPADETA